MTDATTTLTTATQVIDQLATQVKQTAVAYGPDAYNLAIQYVHWTAIFNTIVDVAWIGIAIVLLIISSIGFRKAYVSSIANQSHNTTDTTVFGMVVGVVCLILGGSIFFFYISDLLSAANLMGLFAPKLSLVQHVLDAVAPSSGN